MTFIETLISIAIVGVLFALTTINYLPAKEVASISATKVEMSTLRNAFVLYEIREGETPRNIRDLCRADLTSSCDDVDPFGNEYVLEDGTLISAGPDGEIRSDDDNIYLTL